MKICTECLTEKHESLFYKHKTNLDGLGSRCKKCESYISNQRKRTKKGLVSRMYGNQKSRSKKRGHQPPSYSRLELQDWLFSQELFHKLHEDWETSGYEKLLAPSCDRIDDNIGYSLDNIQLMTWDENNKKAYKFRKDGIVNNTNKAVLQFDKNGNFISEYYSLSEAKRQTSVNVSQIISCCQNKIKTAKGFKWEYKDADNN